MKKITLGLFLLKVLFAGARLVRFISSDANLSQNWTTFQKHPNHPNIVRSYSTTDKEKKQLNIKTPKKKIKAPSRAPASIAKNSLDRIKYDGREVFNFIDKEQEKINALEAINSPSKKWKGLAAGKLLRFQDPETKLLIMPEKSLIKVEEKGARYVEIVQVKFVSKSGKRTSYNALIDSENGELLRSWNQSIQDSPYSRKEKVKLSPVSSL